MGFFTSKWPAVPTGAPPDSWTMVQETHTGNLLLARVGTDLGALAVNSGGTMSCPPDWGTPLTTLHSASRDSAIFDLDQAGGLTGCKAKCAEAPGGHPSRWIAPPAGGTTQATCRGRHRGTTGTRREGKLAGRPGVAGHLDPAPSDAVCMYRLTGDLPKRAIG